MIYFDNASTTPICKTALDNLIEYSKNKFFNASAIYKQGIENKKAIDDCKKLIASFLGVKFEDNIIFTGSATEANNLALQGAYKKSFKKILVSEGEHACTYNTALALKNRGVDVEFVKLSPSGEVDYADLEAKLSAEVSFISIMHVNNETGSINDLKRIAELKKKYCPKAILHSDGVQAFGKIKYSLPKEVDLYTISAHKIHGPKGVGALYVRDKNLLNPIIFGGGQEYNLRSGTENVANIMGFMGAIQEIDYNSSVGEVKQAFIDNLDPNTGFVINGSVATPYILSLSYSGINGETLVHMLEEKQYLISRGSACSGNKTGNRNLSSMSLDKNLIQGSIRVSFSRYNTPDEAVEVSKFLNDCVAKLKQI